MRVGVVGGGITGLAVTHYLAENNVDVVTFEADAEPGGVIHSEKRNGRVLEFGPQRLRLSNEISQLVDDLSLNEDLIRVEGDPPLYVYVDGRLRLVPKSIWQFIRTDLLTWREKLRLLREPFSDPLDPQETITEGFRRKCGDGVTRKMIDPLVGGMYGSTTDTMPVSYALEPLLAFEATHRSLLRGALRRIRSSDGISPVVSFEDGLQTLPTALYERHSPYINLNTPVESIEPFAGNQFAVRTGKGSVGVDHVVLTPRAKTVATLLADFDDATIEPLTELRYNDLVVVHLSASIDRPGFGYQIAQGEGFKTLGVTWNASLLGRSDVHTAFLAGMRNPDLLELPAEKIGRIAAREFEAITDEPATVVEVRKLPSIVPAYDQSWNRLNEIEVPDGMSLATNYTGRIGIPSRIREAKALADQLADR